MAYLGLHVAGYDGDLCEEGKALNQEAPREGGRNFSKYLVTPQEAIYVTTQADRASTAILLPDEY